MDRVTKIKRPTEVVLAMDGRPRSKAAEWLVVFDFTPDDTLADWERRLQGTDLGKQSLDKLRHRGRMNVLFVDGHVATITRRAWWIT